MFLPITLTLPTQELEIKPYLVHVSDHSQEEQNQMVVLDHISVVLM